MTDSIQSPLNSSNFCKKKPTGCCQNLHGYKRPRIEKTSGKSHYDCQAHYKDPSNRDLKHKARHMIKRTKLYKEIQWKIVFARHGVNQLEISI